MIQRSGSRIQLDIFRLVYEAVDRWRTLCGITGDYSIFRPLNMLTNGEPNDLAKALDFILSDLGQAIVAEDYITVN